VITGALNFGSVEKPLHLGDFFAFVRDKWNLW
jgi:hypothetical protein